MHARRTILLPPSAQHCRNQVLLDRSDLMCAMQKLHAEPPITCVMQGLRCTALYKHLKQHNTPTLSAKGILIVSLRKTKALMGKSLAADRHTKQNRALQSAEHNCDTDPTSLRCSSIALLIRCHTCRRQHAACNVLCNMYNRQHDLHFSRKQACHLFTSYSLTDLPSAGCRLLLALPFR